MKRMRDRVGCTGAWIQARERAGDGGGWSSLVPKVHYLLLIPDAKKKLFALKEVILLHSGYFSPLSDCFRYFSESVSSLCLRFLPLLYFSPLSFLPFLWKNGSLLNLPFDVNSKKNLHPFHVLILYDFCSRHLQHNFTTWRECSKVSNNLAIGSDLEEGERKWGQRQL